MKPDRKRNEDQLGSNDRRKKEKKGILQEFFIKRGKERGGFFDRLTCIKKKK